MVEDNKNIEGGGTADIDAQSATLSSAAGAANMTQTSLSTNEKTTLPAPNSKPREQEPAPVETYVYRDFAHAEPSALNMGETHKRAPPQSLHSQKLPSKLAAMLSDPDLASVITWMPHGRSWKILNRELFANFALPRYFGHSNHASFVRIVNAWGFRRITKGPDRDSYYHELFLRGKPRLHDRMKRLPSCHRKTPVNSDEKCPNFYELSKSSPLPDATWNASTGQLPDSFASVPAAVGSLQKNFNPASMMNNGSFMPQALRPIHYGDATGAFSMSGLSGNGIGHGNNVSSTSFNMADNNAMLSLLGMNGNNLGSGNGTLDNMSSVAKPDNTNSLTAYTQNLQRENENLLLKIKLLEYENQVRQQKTQPGQQEFQQPVKSENNQQSSIGGNDTLGNNNQYQL